MTGKPRISLPIAKFDGPPCVNGQWKRQEGAQMNILRITHIAGVLAALIIICDLASAENIDPNNNGSQYAYGGNVGWVNFEPGQGAGATVTDINLTGRIWAENIGWINLSPTSFGGVTNDGTGKLSGCGWGENVGWINFNPQVPGEPNKYGVTIDHQGKFSGWAWGENIGWIHLRSDTPVAYKVQTSWVTTCVVDIDDLGRFCELWLDTGAGLKADFDNDHNVDFVDYDYFADLWNQLCPPGWALKN
jgi:hypothetical protein